MKVLYFVFVCVCLYKNVDGESAPFITPCHPTDSPCMKASAQRALPVVAAGIPSLGIQVLDPMVMEQVKSTQSGLQMDFRNTIVRGLRNCKVESLKRNGNKIYMDLKCSVTMVGDYTLGGELLFVPIQGNGKYKIVIRDILVKMLFDMDERDVNGVKYWNVHSYKYNADVKTGVEFHFQNLFNGNKKLSDSVIKFANSNWHAIFREVSPPIVDAIVAKIFSETKKLFDVVPAHELSLS